MNTDKKSFILHLDMLSVIDGMTDEQAGRLFKAMRSYHMGSEVDLDAVTSMAFSFFKMQFDRDNEKYHNRVESNRSNGAKGGRPKKNKDLKTENPKNKHHSKRLSNELSRFWNNGAWSRRNKNYMPQVLPQPEKEIRKVSCCEHR